MSTLVFLLIGKFIKCSWTTATMVKAVVGEEIQLKSIEDRLSHSRLSCQVGLVIGKISTSLDRGFVFDLVPTPLNDAGEAASWIIEIKDDNNKKKGGSKSKTQSDSSSSLSIDKDWVAEHARQVSRMLVGGMKVVGIYIWMNESLFKNSSLVLCQTVKGVADAAPIRDFSWDERLLIHISYSPSRWTCRNCSLSSNITSSSLRPCDFKMGRVFSTLQKFRCIYNFDIRFPIFREGFSSSKKFAGILRDVILSHAEELKGAKALINGNLVNVDDQCASDSVHEVEFLLPFMHHTSFQEYSQEEVVGILVFTGSVCSYAYSNSKEPISQALTDIKGDIVSSLRSRLDIICDDEANEQLESVADVSGEISNHTPIPQLQLQSLRKGCSLSFPRRVFVPWLGDTYICDYIQPSETLEVVKDHCVELMSMEALTDTSMVLEPEAESASSVKLSTNSFLETAMELSPELTSSYLKDRGSVAGKQLEKSSNVSIIAAMLVLFISVLVGVLLFAFRT
ncbi:hypothetical protein L2E82_38812 [Cichorium intybus]|uniref:Uncharacterized protein n=1 Tax=Cichorium intybus TaxID=13427 RepID=A0ACB9AGI5_CICIN|nr:hypothetical protein L2E82_38812 [Cichorium intybus]